MFASSATAPVDLRRGGTEKEDMNIELLRKIQQKLTDDPEYYTRSQGRCGTVHCMAELAQVLSGCDRIETPWLSAKRVIGLTQIQANLLFFMSEWPMAFQIAYSEASSDQERAAVVSARIEHFIQNQE